MKADMVKKLAIMLMSQNKGMNMNDALSVVFNSDTYQKIMDEGFIIKVQDMYSLSWTVK